MSEKESQPNPEAKITKDTIKARAMEFFTGVNLSEGSITQNGLIRISTGIPNKFTGEISSAAKINGIVVARYTRLISDAPPFEAGKDQVVESYAVFGGNESGSKIAATYTNSYLHGETITLTSPSIMGRDSSSTIAPIESFDGRDQEAIAQTLGLTQPS